MKEKIEIGDLFIDPSTGDHYMLCQYGAHSNEVTLIRMSDGKCWNDHKLFLTGYSEPSIENAMHRISGEWIPILPGNCIAVCQS